MKTLTLTISAPLASYSNSPRLQHRLTQYAPTYSAVIGMIACAMGIDRNASIEHLKTLKMTVLNIAGGDMEQDFQTIRDAVTNDGTPGRNAITTRHYVPDYCAEIELSGDDDLVDAVAQAVQYPRWQLYAGRRSNVLDRPLIAKL